MVLESGWCLWGATQVDRVGRFPNPDDPCMDYLLTLGAKWLHSIGYVGKYSHHGAFGQLKPKHWLHPKTAIWKRMACVQGSACFGVSCVSLSIMFFWVEYSRWKKFCCCFCFSGIWSEICFQGLFFHIFQCSDMIIVPNKCYCGVPSLHPLKNNSDSPSVYIWKQSWWAQIRYNKAFFFSTLHLFWLKPTIYDLFRGWRYC